VKDLELSKEAKDRLARLEELSDRAADDDKRSAGNFGAYCANLGPRSSARLLRLLG